MEKSKFIKSAKKFSNHNVCHSEISDMLNYSDILNNSSFNIEKMKIQNSKKNKINRNIITNDNCKDNNYSIENFRDIYNSNTKEKFTLIHSGLGSKFFLTQNISDKQFYIKKEYDLNKLPENRLIIQKEIDLYKKLNDNPYILKLYASQYIEAEQKYILFVYYANNGSLKNLLEKNKKGLSEEKSFIYFYQILKAIQLLHQNKIIFNRLSVDNILIGKNDSIYLYNLSNCIEINDNNQIYFDYMQDLFCLGIILNGLLYGLNDEMTDKNSSEDYSDLINNLISGEKYNNINDIFQDKWIVNNLHNNSSTLSFIMESHENDNSRHRKSFMQSRYSYYSIKRNLNNDNNNSNSNNLNINNEIVNAINNCEIKRHKYTNTVSEFNYDQSIISTNENDDNEKNIYKNNNEKEIDDKEKDKEDKDKYSSRKQFIRGIRNSKFIKKNNNLNITNKNQNPSNSKERESDYFENIKRKRQQSDTVNFWGNFLCNCNEKDVD